MKKLNDANIGILVLLSTCLCLFSCNNDNDNLPKDYAGFEHSKETVEYAKSPSPACGCPAWKKPLSEKGSPT